MDRNPISKVIAHLPPGAFALPVLGGSDDLQSNHDGSHSS